MEPNSRDALHLKLELKAIQQLLDFFEAKTEEEVDRLLKKAKVAGTALSNTTRHFQTRSGGEALDFMIAREIAKDKDEMRKFMKIARPSMPIVKALKE